MHAAIKPTKRSSFHIICLICRMRSLGLLSRMYLLNAMSESCR